MDLAAPQYCQVCLFSEINEQMAHKPAWVVEARGVYVCECVFARMHENVLACVWCVCVPMHACLCVYRAVACGFVFRTVQ